MKQITNRINRKTQFSILSAVGVVFLLIFSFSSCVKKEFDEPPAFGQDPDLTVTNTIAELKAMWPGSGIVEITTDIIVAGIVVGDDESGNFYKSIVIQDTTAGINIQLDQSEYWRNYQKGRRVFIKCKGLFLGDYGKQVQLGGYIDNSGGGTPSVGRIPQSLIPRYLVGGVWGLSVTPKTTSSISSLDLAKDQNKLVTLHGVHFVPGSSCQTWADLAGQTSGNRDLADASGNTMTVRTSNFADFAASNTPNDTGTITGVFQRYNSTYQLVIHSLNDVQMGNSCCNNPSLITIDSVRKIFGVPPGAVAPCVKVRGIVISDKDNGNITTNNIFLQDNSTPEPRGIIVRFTSPNTFKMGDEIEVNIADDSISIYRGAIQVNGVDITKAVKISAGNVVTPRIATIADIITHFYEWESTLVKINNVTINGSNVSTYSGSKPLIDASTATSLLLYTSSFASFSGVNHPATASSVTGYLTPYYTTFEISIRNTTDVTP